MQRFPERQLKGVRRWLAGLLVLTVLPFCQSWGQLPIGLEALYDFSDLPIYRAGVLAGQVSSADPLGEDSDASSYLYRLDSLFVIFDEEGPGCVYRLWVRSTPESANRVIKFYFDNDTIPQISATLQSFFSGFFDTFLTPLAGNGIVSSGGYYSYTPLPFEQHLRIALVNGIEAHQISFHRYPPGTAVTTYAHDDPTQVVQQWQAAGSDPKSTTGNQTAAGSITLQPDDLETLFEVSGGGSITSLRLTPSITSLSMLEGLKLRCYWDGELIPSVDSPLGSFFGSMLGLAPINGLPLGMQGDNLYCFFPMPFWQNARLEVFNTSLSTSVTIDYEITYKTDPYPTESGYFRVQRQPFQTTAAGEDFVIGDVVGHGQVVGMTVTLLAAAGQDFLAGDLRIYQDGMAAPIILGTDFDSDFNAGNEFTTGTFSRPAHGAPVIVTTSVKKVCAYRFMLGDMIPYASRITLSAEHGNRNLVPLEASALLYTYSRPEIALVLSDVLDVKNAADEAAHNYVILGGQTQQTHTYAYSGSADDQFFMDQGRTHLGVSSFEVAIEPNNLGVRLVRRRDASIFPQSALVKVNDDTVGVWSDSRFNEYRRWDDGVFEIPASFTAGASQIEISLTHLGANQWTEYSYWVYCHVPPLSDAAPPQQVQNVSASERDDGSQLQLAWNPALDNTGIAQYRIYRSLTPGVSPEAGFLVATTALTSYTDYNLQAGTWYYYRIAAVDFSGNEGAASVEIAQRSSGAYVFEAEAFIPFDTSSGDAWTVQNMAAFGDLWSRQTQLRYDANASGDFFSATIAVPFSDTYDVAVYFTKDVTFGIVALFIDGVLLGLPYDAYSPYVLRSNKVEFGAATLSAGEHQLRFSVTGKNAASTGFGIGVDNVLLTSHYLLAAPTVKAGALPETFALHQNYPNPFNAQTRIEYSLAQAGRIQLAIYDVMGRQAAILKDGFEPAGQKFAIWRAENQASGIYFVRLQQGERVQVRKLLLLR